MKPPLASSPEPSRLTGLRAHLSFRLGHWLIRGRADDRYLFAYPRSGSTWLRTILANLIDPATQSNPDRFNALIPGVSIRNARRINQLPSPRLIKSHSPFPGRVPRAVYLVRDGRDVLVSLFHYRITRASHGDAVDMGEFCRRYLRGDLGPMWHENVLSWLERGAAVLGSGLRVVRFEQLKADPIATVTEVAGFLGIPAPAGRVAAAVDQARLEVVRDIERARVGREVDSGQSFYGRGSSGHWRQALVGPDAERVLAGMAPALDRAGYGGGGAP
jgi:hypothetical protein